jgi:hypothetical protein
MKHYIVIAESKMGVHKVDPSVDASVSMYSMTFPITVGKYENRFAVKANLLVNKTFLSIISEYERMKKKAEVYIFVAFDLDETGELMAEALKDSLIFSGITKYDILRTPLTEKGYILLKQFANTNGYKEYLYHQQRIIKALEDKNLPKLGILKIMAMKLIIEYRGKTMRVEDKGDGKINMNGTSTATFVHNFLNADSQSIKQMHKHTQG